MRWGGRARTYGLGLCCFVLPAAVGGAQDARPALPKNYQTVFENGAVEVIHVHYGPHEKVPVHDHSADPTVYVYLSDSGPVRFTHAESRAEGGAGVLVRPPIKAGAFRVSPGRRERHSVENLGDIASDFLRVELKGMPLGTLEPFRGEPPAEVTRSATTIEVKTTTLEIDRLVCAGAGELCSFHDTTSPSLLVAFTPSEVRLMPTNLLRSAQGSETTLRARTVQWVDAGTAVSVRQKGSEAAQLLRIVLPGARP